MAKKDQKQDVLEANAAAAGKALEANAARRAADEALANLEAAEAAEAAAQTLAGVAGAVVPGMRGRVLNLLDYRIAEDGGQLAAMDAKMQANRVEFIRYNGADLMSLEMCARDYQIMRQAVVAIGELESAGDATAQAKLWATVRGWLLHQINGRIHDEKPRTTLQAREMEAYALAMYRARMIRFCANLIQLWPREERDARTKLLLELASGTVTIFQ